MTYEQEQQAIIDAFVSGLNNLLTRHLSPTASKSQERKPAKVKSASPKPVLTVSNHTLEPITKQAVFNYVASLNHDFNRPTFTEIREHFFAVPGHARYSQLKRALAALQQEKILDRDDVSTARNQGVWYPNVNAYSEKK